MPDYNAKEINGGRQVEIQLPAPFGKVKITAVRQRDKQSPVTKADVTLHDKMFQISCLGYADGSWSNYLGNCFSEKTAEGVWF